MPVSRAEDGGLLSDAHPALVIKQLSAYYGPLRVLHEVSMRVNWGETIAVVGPNGSGKTSLLSCIAGIVRRRTGSVKIGGIETIKSEAHAIARLGVGYCMEGRRLFRDMTVYENLRLALTAQRLNPSNRTYWRFVFGLFPVLEERLHQRCGNLSGGQQQMVAIARALIRRPRLLLLDDPCLGLAPKVSEDIYLVLSRLKGEGISMVLVDQDERRARSLADKTFVLRNGVLTMLQ